MKKIIIAQFIVLLCGTIFAWANFGKEFLAWQNKSVCTTGCATDLASPFLTPCFGGAIFFTIAFVLSVILIKKESKKIQ